MAALSYFSNLSSLSCHKHIYFSFPLYSDSPNIFHGYQIHYPMISACSTKKTRADRKVKSNEELCNDIREFKAAVGLPEGHIPSTKELSLHGRQDLANIVRRRGYKRIKQLFATSKEFDENQSGKEGLAEIHDAGGDYNDEPIGQHQKLEVVTGDALSFYEVSTEKSHSENLNDANIRRFVMAENLSEDLTATGEEDFQWAINRSNSDKILNGSILQSGKVVLDESENRSPGYVYFPSTLPIADCDEKLDLEKRSRDNQIEIDQLKLILNQKELELSGLKEQTEREKLALSIMQTKAENEISKAQKLVSEKDTELLAAEGVLSELKEVKIHYYGDGETVEMAGSFNGWHHRITLDRQPSSSILDPIKARDSKVWSRVLWLYPGTYEIKFIVDGHWRIDPQREFVSRGSIQNNILQVDR